MVNWDEMHEKGQRPWDLKGVTPMLKYFFETEKLGKEITSNKKGEIKRILVPGCGQKNDSEYLGLVFGSGIQVIGSDISPTAVKNCQEGLGDNVDNVEFVEDDFFAAAAADDDDGLGDFDLIFDHTFFCAIEPSMRPEWAAKMSKLLTARRGLLLTIIYPLPMPGGQGKEGPPFEVTFNAYEAVLLQRGFECLKRWRNSELPASNEKRAGREELALWRKK